MAPPKGTPKGKGKKAAPVDSKQKSLYSFFAKKPTAASGSTPPSSSPSPSVSAPPSRQPIEAVSAPSVVREEAKVSSAPSPPAPAPKVTAGTKGKEGRAMPVDTPVIKLDDASDCESDSEMACPSGANKIACRSSTKYASRGHTKRRKVVLDSGDEEEAEFGGDDKDSDFEAGAAQDDEEEEDDDGWLESDESDAESDGAEEEEAPRKRQAKQEKTSVSVPAKRPRASEAQLKTLPQAEGDAPPPKPKVDLPEGVLDEGRHEHHKWTWLQPGRRMDKQKRKPGQNGYNPRTLYVDPTFLKKQTPAMQQWWEVKSENMDTVLFFKVGKFYELFHMDADVGFKELDLIYMKGDKAHSGFPEVSYGKYSQILVDNGYRVARVEQTETPKMMDARNARAAKGSKSKVVRRELCSILSKGTRTFCYLDPEDQLESNGAGASVQLLVSISECSLPPPAHVDAMETGDEEDDAPPTPTCVYGVCIVHAPTAQFTFGQFEDGKDRSRLRTLLAQMPPAELLYAPSGTSALSLESLHLIKALAPGALLRPLPATNQFWPRGKTLQELVKEKYFPACQLPAVLQLAIDGGSDCELCLSSFGGALIYLGQSQIDHDLVTMGNFKAYVPPDDCQGESSAALAEHDTSAQDRDGDGDGEGKEQQHMVLDGVSLANLEILQNSFDGGPKGSLLAHMNRCLTAFGSKLLRSWISRPLMNRSAINARLDAVETLTSSLSQEAAELRAKLRGLPDIDLLLTRVHAMGSVHRSKDHPDGRAIMYEEDNYNERKIKDFLSVLAALETASQLPDITANSDLSSSPLLVRCLRLASQDPSGRFPDMVEAIRWFRGAFDAKDKVIRPKPGMDEDYEAAQEAIAQITKELKVYLDENRRSLRCSSLKFHGSVKDRFQIEAPEKMKVPSDWSLKSKKKGVMRYWSPFIIRKLQELESAETNLEDSKKDQMRKLFAKFDEHRNLWAAAANCVAHIDALLSLAEVSSLPGHCRPTLASPTPDGASFLRFKGAQHPCLSLTFQGGEFIPNDVMLGEKDGDGFPRLLLLSGPNMGGKSTLLRQTCLVAIMAQVGCFVPCEEAELAPFDRIFTRVGASDRILAGQSTFYVELSETATILHHATPRSLVILDELGRGTSTFDGTAIAHAVVNHLAQKVRCISMFATHYHSLVEEWNDRACVANGHMGCLVEGESDEQRITFLYKLAAGPCPKSFGINVARLAQLPESVVKAAKAKSEEFEQAMLQRGQEVQAFEGWRRVLAMLQHEPAALASMGEGNHEAASRLGERIMEIWRSVQ